MELLAGIFGFSVWLIHKEVYHKVLKRSPEHLAIAQWMEATITDSFYKQSILIR